MVKNLTSVEDQPAMCIGIIILYIINTLQYKHIVGLPASCAGSQKNELPNYK